MHRTLKRLCPVVAFIAIAMPSFAGAQQSSAVQQPPDSPKPAPKSDPNDSPSRWDIFLGYSYLAPHGTVGGYRFNAINYGAIASVTRYFNNYVGVQGEGDEHILLPENGSISKTQPNNDFSGGSGGLIFRYPTEDITPFVHALVGAEQVGTYKLPEKWGVVLTVGGGMDFPTPLFDHHLGIRIFQADYQYTHENFAPGLRGNFNNARLSAGLVWHIGTIAPPVPPTIACSANPSSVFPGEPVTVTATASGLNPKDNAVYNWSGEGVSGNGTTATVQTANLAPGSYTVKCGVKEGRPGKEGLKPWQNADSSTNFTVKEFEPPTISCSASPTTIKPGDTSTITATGMSPQNRPLTYSYSAPSGSVNGAGTTATYNSAGAPTGPVDISCKVSDDKGHSASSTTTVTIVAPPPPPQPHAQALCSLSFDKDKARPTRVDNEAKACLDQVALNLQQQPDAKAVLVGQSNYKEKARTEREQKYAARHKRAKVEDYAAQRAVNAKDYLVKEKGIDGARISAATSTADGQQVNDYVVPSGANFSSDVPGTTPVDESAVQPQPRKPLPQRHPKGAAQ